MALRALGLMGAMAIFATFMTGLMRSFDSGTPEAVSDAAMTVVIPTSSADEAIGVVVPDEGETSSEEAPTGFDGVLGPTIEPTDQAAIEAEERAEAERQAALEEEREAAEAEEEARREREAAEEDEAARSRERAIADPKATASAMIGDYGWGEDQFECLDLLWTRESNWNYQAQNPSSGAYGIPQSLPASKMESAGSDWQTNPVTQIAWGLGYIDERYGTPCSAWAHSESTGWY
jgi:hypothetical protein